MSLQCDFLWILCHLLDLVGTSPHLVIHRLILANATPCKQCYIELAMLSSPMLQRTVAIAYIILLHPIPLPTSTFISALGLPLRHTFLALNLLYCDFQWILCHLLVETPLLLVIYRFIFANGTSLICTD